MKLWHMWHQNPETDSIGELLVSAYDDVEALEVYKRHMCITDPKWIISSRLIMDVSFRNIGSVEAIKGLLYIKVKKMLSKTDTSLSAREDHLSASVSFETIDELKQLIERRS